MINDRVLVRPNGGGSFRTSMFVSSTTVQEDRGAYKFFKVVLMLRDKSQFVWQRCADQTQANESIAKLAGELSGKQGVSHAQ